MFATLDAVVTLDLSQREAQIIRGFLGNSSPHAAAETINGSMAFSNYGATEPLEAVTSGEFSSLARALTAALRGAGVR